MGVYIDMEMPTEGYIDVRIKCNGTASFAIANNPYFKAVEAVPIPPHGRLIDADKLLSQYKGNIWTAQTDYAEGLRDVANDIKQAPTVIEAEEGET